MRLAIEIVAALLLVICVTATSAAFAADRPGRTADGLGCHFSLPQNASPAARICGVTQGAWSTATGSSEKKAPSSSTPAVPARLAEVPAHQRPG